MIVSGRMRARTPEEDTNVCRVEAYFGTDAGLFDDHWPVSHVGVASPPPVIFMPLHHQTSVMAHMKTADDVPGSAPRAPGLAKPGATAGLVF